MNNNIHESSKMGHDTTIATSSGYASDNWTSMSPFSQSPYSASPMTEHTGFFSSYIPQGLPSESIHRMPPPPPTTQTHQMIQPAPPPMTHPQLPMLNTTWPSQLTNPSPSGGYSTPHPAPPLSMNSASSAPPPLDPPLRIPAPNEKSRKTLTTDQKRRMCQYHEDNPGTRQADIGAKFGVERSTVSKVLRQRDVYLKRDTEPDPLALKRGNKKHPDFDRTLSNYVRRQMNRGFQVSDDEIMEQARLFAHGSGHQESLIGSLTSSWLLKFKQKHGIGAGKLMRRASEANIPDSARMSTLASKSDKPTDDILSSSPIGNQSPVGDSRSDEDVPREGLPHDGLGFAFDYKQSEVHSTASLTSDLPDNMANSFSASTMSPTAPFTFSPDPNAGSFSMNQGLQIRSNPVEYQQHREKRSNTFPSLNLDYIDQQSNLDSMTPRHPPTSTAPSSALDSPIHELQAAPFSIDTNITSPSTLHRSSSNSSMNRSSATPVTTSAISSTPNESSPVSPSQEDARRAAATLLSYIQHTGSFDNNEYMTVVQLTKKLQLHQHQAGRPMMGIGGLSRIPEGDVELPLQQTKIESA